MLISPCTTRLATRQQHLMHAPGVTVYRVVRSLVSSSFFVTRYGTGRSERGLEYYTREQPDQITALARRDNE